MMTTQRRNLSELLAQANTLKADCSTEEISATVSAIREALATGLNGDFESLRDFLSIAYRFDHFADTWNASQLLAEQGELDSHARAARVASWLRLFPDAARRRPRLALELLGKGGTGGISAAKLSGILSGWLEWSVATYDRTEDAKALIGSLLAAAEIAECWWPNTTWVEIAPAFAAAYASTAIRVAPLLKRAPGLEVSGVSCALATALELQSWLHEVGDSEPDVSEAPASNQMESGDAYPHPQAVTLGDEELRSLATELNGAKRRIWVVGALKPKWAHLMGVAKTFGLEPAVFEHVDYKEVKQKPMLQRINLVRDFGVLLGPVPHSANELGNYSSLATQLKTEAGVSVVELRTQSASQELRITKTSFREGLLRLLADGLLRSAA